MRKIDWPAFTVTDVLEILKYESTDFIEFIDIYGDKVFNQIVDFFSYYESEYINNQESLAALPVIDSSHESFAFSSIKDYYKEYHVGGSLYSIREVMEELVKKRCPICDCSFAYSQVTLDHILPQKKYPFYSITPINLVPTCYNCNMRKNDTVPSEVLHPYFHGFSIFDYLKVSIDINEDEPVKSRVIIDFSDRTKGTVNDNIDLYKLREKYTDLINISFLKLMDEFQQIISLKNEVYSIGKLKNYFELLDNYCKSSDYDFIDEVFLRHKCIEAIAENIFFLECLAKKLNIFIDYNKELDSAIEQLWSIITSCDYFYDLGNNLELVKENLPIVVFIGMYEFIDDNLKLINFRGVYQKEKGIFEFKPVGDYLIALKNNQPFSVNESVLILNANPKNQVGTEIVVPLDNGNFCILLIDGSFKIEECLLEKMKEFCNQFFYRKEGDDWVYDLK